VKSERLTIDKLNELYDESDRIDQEIFAEQRSNINLVSGDHYSKKNNRYWNRVRETKDLSNEQKLRLTKNHIQKITKTYVNNIISHAPSVAVVPNNQKETQDQKAAQLNNSVWQYARHKHSFRHKTQLWAKDFVDLGEVAVKIFWDPGAGNFLGYEAEVDENGQPLMDESGNMVPSETPKFSGDFVFERIFGFNLLRDAAAKSMDEAKFLIVRKMVDVEELKKMVSSDPDKVKMINDSKDDTYMVFDGNQQNYTKTKGQTMLKEYYFKPSLMYPEGYFYITVSDGILFEGPLPFSIYPIIYTGFDEIQTSARHRSIVKQLRPYQSELNRTSSKIAEHQITLGDDKILIQSGTKITTGIHLPGVRSIQYSGVAPTVLSGRAGDQYFQYAQSQISEMYQVANLDEDMAMKDGKFDPFGQLFMSLRDKKKFTIYAERFEYFLINICRTYLDLSRHYFSEGMIIPMIGRSEIVNIEEFKNTNELCYSIKLEPQTDNIESIMGRQLSIQHVLQYVGPQMAKEDIGKLIRTMPFANLDESFNDLTLDYDTGTNLILALDRGERPEPNKYDNHQYMIKRLVARVRQSDFKSLAPEVQSNYYDMIKIYETSEVEIQKEILLAQSEFIPSGGARIKVDYYVSDPNNSSRTIRATLPAESVDWLIKKLAQQGSSQEQLVEIGQAAAAEMSAQFNQQLAMQKAQGQAQGPSLPGSGMPISYPTVRGMP
jgi:hypothetical protein